MAISSWLPGWGSTFPQLEEKREGAGELLLSSVRTLTEALLRSLCTWVFVHAHVTCIHFAGSQTCLFCIWFDATDEEWVGSTKRGHQGMERILKGSKKKPEGSVTTGGKRVTFDAISCSLPIPYDLWLCLPKSQQTRTSLPVQNTHPHSEVILTLFTWPSSFSELYSWCELFLQVSQTSNIGKYNCETNRRFSDNLEGWDSNL